jgi:protein-tyrosine-phosphatase
MDNTITPQFVYLANVWRSQKAEGLYNNIHWEWASFSCAWWEARKTSILYNWKPAESIIELMKNQAWIDISHQRIKYLSDLWVDILTRVNRVAFLVKEPEKMICEVDCRYNWLTPYEYLKSHGFIISAHEIIDPNLTSQTDWVKFFESIKDVVENKIR